MCDGGYLDHAEIMVLRAEPVRCLIVDDSPDFLAAAATFLEQDGFTVVGVASTIAETLRSAEILRPNVMLVDVYLGGESGFDLAEQLHRGGCCPRSAVILTSTHNLQDFAEMVATSPAVGFLPKMALSPGAIRELLAAPEA
ncbi:MAG: chemotaxis protein CheY [Mycobacterium sp.]|jgi:DNA-binding NarL/FixJ family response regulator|nr:chemotaxis protein CheY [Mycobacterium sp.]